MPVLFSSYARDEYMRMKRLREAPNGIGHFLLAVSSNSRGQLMNIRTATMKNMLPVMAGLDSLICNVYMYGPSPYPDHFSSFSPRNNTLT